MIVSYQQARLYIRPTKKRESVIKVYREVSTLPDCPLTLLTRTPILEIDETQTRLKRVQVGASYHLGEHGFVSGNMVKYNIKEVELVDLLYTDLTVYTQYPTIDLACIHYFRIDHEAEELLVYDSDGTEVTERLALEEVALIEGQELSLSLQFFNDLPVYAEISHTFEAYSVKDNFQKTSGVTYFGPPPGLAPQPVFKSSLKETPLTLGTSLPSLELTVYQPTTTEQMQLVYANQEKVFIEVGEEDEHLHEDVYLFLKHGGTLQSTLHHYRAIALGEDHLSSLSRDVALELFCDPENLFHRLEVLEEEGWVSVRDLPANETIEIGAFDAYTDEYNTFTLNENKSFTTDDIQVDLSALGRSRLTMSVPNVFNRYHTLNYQDTPSYRIACHYLHLDTAYSEPLTFGEQYIPIERVLIYKSIGNHENDLSQPDFEFIREYGLYYDSRKHSHLMVDQDVLLDAISICSSQNIQPTLEFQDVVARGETYTYTFILQDAYGRLHEPFAYTMTL